MNKQGSPDLVWHPIPGFEGYYASKNGNLGSEWMPTKSGSRKTGKIRTLKSTSRKGDGYCHATLVRSGKKHSVYVHKIIALTFLGECPSGLQVRHWDGIKSNNALAKLRHGTPSENEADKLRHGKSTRGVKHNTCKLTERQVLQIRQRVTNGGSDSDIAKDYQVHRRSVWAIRNRKSWGWL